VFVEGELRGDAVDGSQNPRIWTGSTASTGQLRGNGPDGQVLASARQRRRPIAEPRLEVKTTIYCHFDRNQPKIE